MIRMPDAGAGPIAFNAPVDDCFRRAQFRTFREDRRVQRFSISFIPFAKMNAQHLCLELLFHGFSPLTPSYLLQELASRPNVSPGDGTHI